MGLVNRVVPAGQALRAALELARELADLPQTCLRNDRLSMLESLDLDGHEAMENEVRRGLQTLSSGETSVGAARFHGGAGRHGR
jgi:enoyl-CoA hydratase